MAVGLDVGSVHYRAAEFRAAGTLSLVNLRRGYAGADSSAAGGHAAEDVAMPSHSEPSLVYLDETGALVGAPAEWVSRYESGSTSSRVARMSDFGDRTAGSPALRIDAAVHCLLRQVVASVDAVAAGERILIGGCMPFGCSYEELAILRAARIAGVELALVDPWDAALAWALHRRPDLQAPALLCDWGGSGLRFAIAARAHPATSDSSEWLWAIAAVSNIESLGTKNLRIIQMAGRNWSSGNRGIFPIEADEVFDASKSLQSALDIPDGFFNDDSIHLLNQRSAAMPVAGLKEATTEIVDGQNPMIIRELQSLFSRAGVNASEIRSTIGFGGGVLATGGVKSLRTIFRRQDLNLMILPSPQYAVCYGAAIRRLAASPYGQGLQKLPFGIGIVRQKRDGTLELNSLLRAGVSLPASTALTLKIPASRSFVIEVACEDVDAKKYRALGKINLNGERLPGSIGETLQVRMQAQPATMADGAWVDVSISDAGGNRLASDLFPMNRVDVNRTANYTPADELTQLSVNTYVRAL